MWAIGRRSAFFVISYAPLAAMFVVLKWPKGWSSCELVALAAWIVAIVVVLITPSALTVAHGRFSKALVAVAAAVAIATVVYGVAKGWYDPLGFHPKKPRTAATSSGIAFGICVLAGLLVLMIVYNARRASDAHWTVADPRDQGAAVAGYLATYLLPLIDPEAGGWRVTTAYAIYFATLYLVYIRSESLVLINPTLYVLRYRIYDVEIQTQKVEDRRRVLLLTKSPLTGATEVDTVPLGDSCYMVKEDSS